MDAHDVSTLNNDAGEPEYGDMNNAQQPLSSTRDDASEIQPLTSLHTEQSLAHHEDDLFPADGLGGSFPLHDKSTVEEEEEEASVDRELSVDPADDEQPFHRTDEVGLETQVYLLHECASMNIILICLQTAR